MRHRLAYMAGQVIGFAIMAALLAVIAWALVTCIG